MSPARESGHPQSKVTLVAFGDVYLGEHTMRIDDSVRRVTAAADVVVVNLESPLSTSGTARGNKSVYLRSDPANVSILERLSATVACLANNHICDYGEEALAETLGVLSDRGIRATGAGHDLAEAEAPVILDVNGLRLGILAGGSREIQTVAAGKDHCGAAVIDGDRMVERIRRLKAETDVVVVAVHWGYTNYHRPLPRDVALGRRLIDAGAALVLGHHPHVVQGVLRYGGGAIVFSMGNFIFDTYTRGGRPVRLSRENRLSVGVVARLEAGGIGALDFVHLEQAIDPPAVRVLGGRTARRRERMLRRLGRHLGGEAYPRYFKRYVVCRMLWRALRWLHPAQWRSIHRGYLGGLRVAARLIFSRRHTGS
jgi:poly-gamma-glutamate capsule biosynthesis protein CapA/YwtB (metallophosphatase superfamily)